MGVTLLISSICKGLASQAQTETPSAQLEQLQQIVLENSKNVMKIKTDFEKRLLVLENDLKESQDERLRTKEELTRTKSQVTTPSSKARESSFVSVCGFQPLSWRTLGTVLFESISSEYNNPGNMLDLSTGMFTVYTAGVYTINYNTLSWINYGGGEVKMMVFHNGVEVPETEIYSYASEHAHDMASRSLVRFLALGDTLELRLISICSGCQPNRITMCVSLIEEWLL